MSKSFFVDTSKCTACRGCQVACKEWYELPANQTKQLGSHQNPPDLNPNNYKVVRFSEYLDDDGAVHWYFFSDQCRHCLDPPCLYFSSLYMDGAIIQDQETGAVIYTEKTKELSEEAFQEIKDVCPYNIPRRNSETGLLSKCTMCNERVTKGLLPICVEVCPTGAMNFGERQDMLDLAYKRWQEIKEDRPLATLTDPENVRVIYLLTNKPERYYQFSVAQTKPGIDRKTFLARLFKPLAGRGRKILGI